MKLWFDDSDAICEVGSQRALAWVSNACVSVFVGGCQMVLLIVSSQHLDTTLVAGFALLAVLNELNLNTLGIVILSLSFSLPTEVFPVIVREISWRYTL